MGPHENYQILIKRYSFKLVPHSRVMRHNTTYCKSTKKKKKKYLSKYAILGITQNLLVRSHLNLKSLVSFQLNKSSKSVHPIKSYEVAHIKKNS